MMIPVTICNDQRCCLSKKCLCSVVLGFLLMAAVPLWADSNNSSKSNWVLAATAFSGNSDLSEHLPSLILSSLPENLERTIDAGEQIDRQRLAIQKELPTLVNNLNSLITKRDSVVLTSDSQSVKQEKIQDLDKQIAETRQKIDDCRSFASLDSFEPAENSKEPLQIKENLVTLRGDETDDELGTKAQKESFQALLQGTILERGNYLYATVTVTRFPGNQLIGSCDSLYPKTSANLLADDIAQQLVTILVNKAPVTIKIDIENAPGKVTVRMDGVPLVNYTQPVITQAGVHHFSVEAENCATQGFSYDFSGKTGYQIHVLMKPSVDVSLTVHSVTDNGLLQRLMNRTEPDSGDSSIYLMGGTSIKSGASVTVNGLPVLGEIVTETGDSAFFIVEKQRNMSGGNVALQTSVSPKSGNTSKTIDLRRRSMYTAFGLFLISLPVGFGSYGKMEDYAAQIESRYRSKNLVEPEELWQGYERWRKINNVSSVISAGFGINWAIQLTRYILAANQVLPEIVYPEEIE